MRTDIYGMTFPTYIILYILFQTTTLVLDIVSDLRTTQTGNNTRLDTIEKTMTMLQVGTYLPHKIFSDRPSATLTLLCASDALIS